MHIEHNTNSQSKFKNLMLNSSLFDFGDAYILVSGTVTVTKTKEQKTQAIEKI